MAHTLTSALTLSACAVLLAACQTYGIPSAESASDQTAAASPPAFVEATCAGCHAVEPPFLSPNPESPTFEAIANREGLSEETLATWLTDAHNYPEVMDFDLSPEQAQEIADYMITLRSDAYRQVK